MIQPSVKTLSALFIYEPESDRLVWRERDRNLSGKEAGGIDPGHGYRRVRIGKGLYLAHRVAMALTNGKWAATISSKRLGVYHTKEEAIAARQAAERAAGFHENHGRA